jgi:beta-phosphoglucomutase
LKQKGKKIAIGSSSKNAPIILKQVGLAGCFDAVADGNDIKHSKPNPEVFLLAARRMGVEPQDCIVIEDADAGIEAAKAGGMLVLGVGAAAHNPKADFVATSLCDPNARLALITGS